MTAERLRWRTVGLALLATVVAGCGQPQSDVTDSSRVAPVVDSEPAAAAPAAPAQPESHIGKMSLLDAPGSGGSCNVEPRADPRIKLLIPYPLREITVEVGDSNRAFRPTTLDIAMSRSIGAEQERESFYATFDATGHVKVGTREYRTSGTPSVNEQRALFAEDTAAARQLALQVIDLCRAELQAAHN
jgi:hypothetical protein